MVFSVLEQRVESEKNLIAVKRTLRQTNGEQRNIHRWGAGEMCWVTHDTHKRTCREAQATNALPRA